MTFFTCRLCCKPFIEGGAEIRDLTIHDLTLTNQIAGKENARPDYGRPNVHGLTMKDLTLIHDVRPFSILRTVMEMRSGCSVCHADIHMMMRIFN